MARAHRPSTLGARHRSGAVGLLVAGALLLTACGSSSKGATPTTAAVATTASTPATTAAPVTTAAGTTAPATTAAATTVAGPVDPGPAKGDPFVIGFVNTEGTPGLDFPDIRKDLVATVDYLNQHGGFGGRPIKIESCIAKGSPETSQACAQEIAGKKVQLVLLGLDLFPDYKTYKAASIPVIGVLPILPGDYTAEALFLTGGNATTMAAVAKVATDAKFYGAKTIGIVSSDNAGANASAASLEASLKVAGVTFKTVKGGDNETDAGYQSLMREATKDKPDLLISLYSDAGCIGTMRGRASLGIKTPVITTSICAGKDVLDAVGDDATGWIFAGVQSDADTPEAKVMRKILAPVMNIPEAKVTANNLGLGGLGFLGIMSLTTYANKMAAAGKTISGQALYDYLKTTKGLTLYGGQTTIACGDSAKYPAICTFTFPFAEYKAGGKVETIKGGEAVSSIDLLP